jgi:hypothetical protein
LSASCSTVADPIGLIGADERYQGEKAPTSGSVAYAGILPMTPGLKCTLRSSSKEYAHIPTSLPQVQNLESLTPAEK